jgi:hypothetical protein
MPRARTSRLAFGGKPPKNKISVNNKQNTREILDRKRETKNVYNKTNPKKNRQTKQTQKTTQTINNKKKFQRQEI